MLGIIVAVLAILFCLYLGYQNGILKEFIDFIILSATTIAAGIISDKLCGFIYKFVPFLNFAGKSEGLKAINFILWKLILYVLIIFILIFVIRRILKKTGLEERINESIIEANLIKKILGTIMSLPLAFVLLFNIFLILLSPNFNLTSLKDSSVTSFIMEKTPLYSNGNKNLYENEIFILGLLNDEEITPDNFEDINEQIVSNYIETELVDEDLIRELEDKMIGERSEKKEMSRDDEEDLEDDEDWPEEDEEDWPEEDEEDLPEEDEEDLPEEDEEDLLEEDEEEIDEECYDSCLMDCEDEECEFDCFDICLME